MKFCSLRRAAGHFGSFGSSSNRFQAPIDAPGFGWPFGAVTRHRGGADSRQKLGRHSSCRKRRGSAINGVKASSLRERETFSVKVFSPPPPSPPTARGRQRTRAEVRLAARGRETKFCGSRWFRSRRENKEGFMKPRGVFCRPNILTW